MTRVLTNSSIGNIAFFFFNDTATTEIYTLSYTLSLHDALPIYPDVPAEAWQVLPNYPPEDWCAPPSRSGRTEKGDRLRFVYVGSASFADTYVEDIVRWAAEYPDDVELHLCGYNVAEEVWRWLERERFANVSWA